MIHVLLIDDHPIVRAGCRRLLEEREDVRVTEGKTAAEAVRLAARHRPDVIILDLNLPDVSGFDVLRNLSALQPPAPVLVFSMYEDPAFVARALEAGAKGYVSKNDDPEMLFVAIERVLKDEIHLGHKVAEKLALQKLGGAGSRGHLLSPREREVLALLAEGKTLSEIAAALGVSYRTVANACAQLKDKLKVRSIAGLVRFALQEPEMMPLPSRPTRSV